MSALIPLRGSRFLRGLSRLFGLRGGVLGFRSDGTPAILPPGTDGEVLSRSDLDELGIAWVAGGGGGGTPSSTVVSETKYNQSADAGKATTFSRGDHTHGTPALPSASDVGADPAGTASTAVSSHAALTSSVHGISAFGATLVDDADAAAARTTLELGAAAIQDGSFGSWAAPLVGAAQWYCLGAQNNAALASAGGSLANTVYCYSIAIHRPATLASIGIYTVSDAAGTVRVGLYRATGALAGTKVIDVELTPSNAAAASTANTTALLPGAYYVAVLFSNASVVLRSVPSGSTDGAFGRPDCGVTTTARSMFRSTRTYGDGLPTAFATLVSSPTYLSASQPAVFIEVT